MPWASLKSQKSRSFRHSACIVVCWLACIVCFRLGHLSYVGETIHLCHRGAKLQTTTMLVRERRGTLLPKTTDVKTAGGERSKASSFASDGEKDARRLTSQIKKVLTPAELLGILDEAVDAPYFNCFHVSAAYHRLAIFQQSGSLPRNCAESTVLPRLNSQVENMLMLEQLDARATANVLWALAVLLGAVPLVTSLIHDLAQDVQDKASELNTHDLSNCLWASAKLKDVAPDVLNVVPALIAQIRGKAGDMIPQQLSNCLWASAHLKDDAPDVLDIVPALAAHIPRKASDMIPQALSNCLWASAHLKDDADVLNVVPALIAQIPGKAGDMIPQQLSNCLWASARLKDVAPDVLNVVPALIAQIPGKLGEMVPQELSNCLWASAHLKDDAP